MFDLVLGSSLPLILAQISTSVVPPPVLSNCPEKPIRYCPGYATVICVPLTILIPYAISVWL